MGRPERRREWREPTLEAFAAAPHYSDDHMQNILIQLGAAASPKLEAAEREVQEIGWNLYVSLLYKDGPTGPELKLSLTPISTASSHLRNSLLGLDPAARERLWRAVGQFPPNHRLEAPEFLAPCGVSHSARVPAN